MGRSRFLRRRAAANRGLLSLVAVLVAAVAATAGVTLGSVQSTAVEGARGALEQVAEPARTLVVTTRLAGDPAAQDARVREVVDSLFEGVPLDVTRTEVPDDSSSTPFVTWTLAPLPEAVGPADLGVVAGGAERLRTVLYDDDAVAVRGLTVDGTLGETAEVAHEALRAAQAVAGVPVTLLGLVSLVALVQVARLLAATREPEVGLAVSRGASARQVTAAAVLEAALLAAAAAATGSAAAAGILAARGELDGTARTVALTGAAVAVLAIGALGVVAGLQVRAAARRQVTDRSGRARQAAALGTVLLTLVLASVCLLQLRRYGSPLVTTPDGVRTDPLATAAPALVLASLAVVVLAVTGPVARAWAAGAARGRGATAVLAARHVSRRLVLFVVPVVLLVLASGASVLAASYAGTSQGLRTDAATLRTGTDVRVGLAPSGPLDVGMPAPDAAAYAAIEGAAAAAPVLTLDTTVDSEPVALVGIPAGSVPDVVRAPAGTSDVGALARVLDAGDAAMGPALPAGVTGLTVAVTASAAVDEAERETLGLDIARPLLTEVEDGRSLGVRVWLAAADGTLALLDGGTLDYDLDADGDGRLPVGPTPTTHRLDVELPAGTPREWSLAGIDLQVSGAPLPLVVAARVDAVTARTPGGEVPVDVGGTSWSSAPGVTTRTLEADVAQDGPGVAVRPADAQAARVRLVPGEGSAEPVPVAVSAPLADALGLAPGHGFELTTAGSRLPVTVASVVGVVPGELRPFAAVADLTALHGALLRTTTQLPRPGEVWVAARAPGDVPVVARDAAAIAGEGARVRTSAPTAADVDAAAPVRATFGLTTAGAVALALVGVAAVAVAMLRSRRHEVVVLRAVGVPPRHQGTGRATELLAVGLVAIVAGVAAGAVVARLAVPGLARATLTGVATTPDAVLRLDAWLLAAPLAALAVGLLAVAAGVGARVVAQARDTEYREEVR